MGDKDFCGYCIYYGPHSQEPKIADYWCFRHDMRVIDKTPKCPDYDFRDGPELSVNAPYEGIIEREKDRKREHRINLLLSGIVGILGVIIGVVLGKLL